MGVLSIGGLMEGCFVYIMRSGNKQGPLKIGIAKDPESRISILQTGNPFPISLMIKIYMPSREDAYHLEQWLHRRFWRARMEGEWFDSRRVVIKTALDEYPGAIGRDDIERVSKDLVFGFKSRGKIERLIDENRLLMAEVERLRGSIEEILDGRIDMSHI